MLSVNLSVTATREATELGKAGSSGEGGGVGGAPLEPLKAVGAGGAQRAPAAASHTPAAQRPAGTAPGKGPDFRK